MAELVPTTKECTRCHRRLPATSAHFHRHRPAADGLKPRCKECRCAEEHATYAALSAPAKAAYLGRVATWRSKNTRRVNEINQKWYRENRPRRLVIKAQFHKRKKATDPRYRLCHAISSAIGKSLRGKKKAGRRWQNLVGYSLEQLKAHLEAKFLPGMTWSNHGEWHIDHKRPISSFTITSTDDSAFRECWGLSNLQPLWAADNLRKLAKWAS
jgi:hypothetical protein